MVIRPISTDNFVVDYCVFSLFVNKKAVLSQGNRAMPVYLIFQDGGRLPSWI